MPTEVEYAAERARQQSEMFMERSRSQMLQTYQEQRAVLMGNAPQTAVAAMSQHPPTGTPAGRLMDTINSLVRRGATMGGAAIAPVGQMFAGAGAGIGAGIGFVQGGGPFGAAGLMGGGGENRGLGFWQSMFTAFGGALPMGLGRYAGQRLDMTTGEARQLAREELGYRLSGGARQGLYDVWDIAGFGLPGMIMRRAGLEFQIRDVEYFTRRMQERGRYLTGEEIRAAGVPGGVGAVGRGITREGARAYAETLAERLGALQAETGISRREAMGLLGGAERAMGTLGITRLMAQGPERFAAGMEQQARRVREIRQILHLSDQEAEQYFQMLGEMYGSVESIARMARQGRTQAFRMGMGVRETTEMFRGFADVGRQMGLGQFQTAQIMMQGAGVLRQWQGAGVIPIEQLGRYGGQTSEEMIRQQMLRRWQVGMNVWQQPGMGQMVGMLATQDPRAFGQFMGGGMGLLGAFGAAGGAMMRDPLAFLRATYSREQMRLMGGVGMPMAFQMARGAAAPFVPMFPDPADRQLLTMHFYRQITKVGVDEAINDVQQFEAEERMFRFSAWSKYGKGRDLSRQTQDMYSIYQKIIAQGAGDAAMSATNTRTVRDAAAALYDASSAGGKNKIAPELTLDEIILKGGGTNLRNQVRGSVAQQFQEFMDPLEKQWSAAARAPGTFAGQIFAGGAEAAFGGPTGQIRIIDILRRQVGERMQNIGPLLESFRQGGLTQRGINELLFSRQGQREQSMRVLWDPTTRLERIRGIDRSQMLTITATRDNQFLVEMGNDRWEGNYDQLREKYGDTVAGQLSGRIFDNINRNFVKGGLNDDVMRGLRTRGLAIAPEIARYRQFVRGRGEERLREAFGEISPTNMFGGVLPTVTYEQMLAGIAVSDEEGHFMTSDARQRIEMDLRRAGIGASLETFRALVTSRNWLRGHLEWAIQARTPEERAAHISAVFNIPEEQIAGRIARMMDRPEEDVKRILSGRATAEENKEFLAQTRLEEIFKEGFITDISKLTDQTAKTPVPDGTTHRPFQVVVSSHSNEALRQLGRAK